MARLEVDIDREDARCLHEGDKPGGGSVEVEVAHIDGRGVGHGCQRRKELKKGGLGAGGGGQRQLGGSRKILSSGGRRIRGFRGELESAREEVEQTLHFFVGVRRVFLQTQRLRGCTGRAPRGKGPVLEYYGLLVSKLGWKPSKEKEMKEEPR